MALLEMNGVRKRFGGVLALDDASLSAAGGEVHALLGPNGSGKSTLNKTLTGVVVPDRASITIDGSPVAIHGPRDAHAHGVAAVYQQLSVVDDLTVTQNVVLGLEPTRRLGLLDRRAARTVAAEVLTRFSPAFAGSVPYDAAVGALSPGEQQIVEICKALARRPRILVLDEATASLHKEQVHVLFEVVRELRDSGVLVVFTSHRMDEVFALCDQATVLRNGRTVGTIALADATEDQLVHMMVGDVERREEARRSHASDRTVLQVRGLTTQRLRDVSFSVAQGEVLGLGGLQGQGQSDLLLAMFGAAKIHAGEVLYDGVPLPLTSPVKAARAGVALVPGDRGRQGMFAVRPIQENLSIASMHRRATARLALSQRAERRAARGIVERLNIVIGGLADRISTLSGGNQQKVVIGKWLLNEPRVVLLDDPTKGIDITAKEEVYAIIRELADSGAAVVFNSSDNRELLEMSDRVLVLFEGGVVDELTDAQVTEEDLVASALRLEAGETL
ncbi:sugar ABC transporter ATP-binding protein [Phytoactinopolyspora limicola]|uniref:sugar ABC transporter ATP-binding protein n=1 Tax=Phytoactinopolyspora limicola TaxID=2715536 RepID=UPI00140C0F32|nr:sugar ABC transporter ATP-binding protein [Phytoactinopolyspora limicola]